MQCEKIRNNGDRCRASALKSQKLCAIHANPATAAELGQRGGRRRTIFDSGQLADISAPATTLELRNFLAQVIIETRIGKIDPRVANAVSCLSATLLRTAEIIDIEERLRRLEGKINDASQVLAQPRAACERNN